MMRSFILINQNNFNLENDEFDQNESSTITKPEIKLKKPSLYKVLLLNDDYTPMDFVILVLMKFFKKSEQQASDIMISVHKKGSGLAGVYTYEVAETKVFQVNSFSKNQKHPFKCIMEKE